METIILNLLENSVKYGATEITCHITQHSNSIVLMVKDNGLGIEKEEQKLIFKKFYRIINNNVHTTTGLGIGLYQVQQIVQQLNGNIELISKINTGTTFKISLPYA
jgi:two-component system phosphate regulon sensor histidine kinase PhoR